MTTISATEARSLKVGDRFLIGSDTYEVDSVHQRSNGDVVISATDRCNGTRIWECRPSSVFEVIR